MASSPDGGAPRWKRSLVELFALRELVAQAVVLSAAFVLRAAFIARIIYRVPLFARS